MSTDRNVIEQAREANYLQLKEFLKTNGIRLSRKEFSAVLYALNGMTVYDIRKADSIRRSSEKYGIPQSTVKKILDKMGVKSSRLRKAQKEFGMYHSIGVDRHRKKIEDAT